MRRVRLVLLALLVAGVGVVMAGSAIGWMSDSGEFHWSITVARAPEETVWVCKMVGPPDDPHLAPGENPIEVSVNSASAAEAFSDAHPSYVVEEGEQCVEPSIGEEPDREPIETTTVPDS